MNGSNEFIHFSNFLELLCQNRATSSNIEGNKALRIEKTKYKISINKSINKVLSFYFLNTFLFTLFLLCEKFRKLVFSKLNKRDGFEKVKELSNSLTDRILEVFSFWFPKARDYGYYASDLYAVNESFIAVFIPLPIVENGSYRLWLFTFSKVERITPKLRDIWLKDLLDNEALERVSHLTHFEHHFIVSDIIRGKITPKFGRRSVYIIKSDYAYKVYEITAKSIEGFIRSFRKNVKYGEDLLELCDEMERFAAILREEAEKLRAESSSHTRSPTHHPAREGEGKETETERETAEKARREARDYLNLLSSAEVIR